MLDQATQAAILQLHKRGYSARKLCRELCVSRSAVRNVLMAADRQVVRLAGHETMALFDRMDKEDDDVGPGYASRDSSTA